MKSFGRRQSAGVAMPTDKFPVATNGDDRVGKHKALDVDLLIYGQCRSGIPSTGHIRAIKVPFPVERINTRNGEWPCVEVETTGLTSDNQSDHPVPIGLKPFRVEGEYVLRGDGCRNPDAASWCERADQAPSFQVPGSITTIALDVQGRHQVDRFSRRFRLLPEIRVGRRDGC